MTISIPFTQVYQGVGTFLQTVVGVDPATGVPVEVTRGKINLVSMPKTAFINMWAEVSGRLRTNIDTWDQTTQVQSTEIGTKVKVRLDFYGPLSHDWSTTVEGLWRDTYGVAQLKPFALAPLYGSDPIHATLVDGEENYEDRWILDLFLQYNPVVTAPQQTALPPLKLTVVNVEQKYPPTD